MTVRNIETDSMSSTLHRIDCSCIFCKKNRNSKSSLLVVAYIIIYKLLFVIYSHVYFNIISNNETNNNVMSEENKSLSFSLAYYFLSKLFLNNRS